MACAFKVSRVIDVNPGRIPPITIQWYSKTAKDWRNDAPLPTRGEYLIRSGGDQSLRPVRAVLELCPPYLARLRANPLEIPLRSS
jgi:hypothetical protein